MAGLDGRAYHRVTFPAPWNARGVSTVTARTGDVFDVYLCIGRQRVRLREAEAWALLAALDTAMTEAFDPPLWVNDLTAETTRPDAEEAC